MQKGSDPHTARVRSVSESTGACESTPAAGDCKRELLPRAAPSSQRWHSDSTIGSATSSDFVTPCGLVWVRPSLSDRLAPVALARRCDRLAPVARRQGCLLQALARDQQRFANCDPDLRPKSATQI
jgi:hypothetical protein